MSARRWGESADAPTVRSTKPRPTVRSRPAAILTQHWPEGATFSAKNCNREIPADLIVNHSRGRRHYCSSRNSAKLARIRSLHRARPMVQLGTNQAGAGECAVPRA